jgi:hypothetical protein
MQRNGTPFAFFAWLAHVPSELAERIRSGPAPRSIERGNPKGAGLEGRCEASYALNVPAKQNGLCYGIGGTYAAITSDNLR